MFSAQSGNIRRSGVNKYSAAGFLNALRAAAV
jgi:hypothetical protein